MLSLAGSENETWLWSLLFKVFRLGLCSAVYCCSGFCAYGIFRPGCVQNVHVCELPELVKSRPAQTHGLFLSLVTMRRRQGRQTWKQGALTNYLTKPEIPDNGKRFSVRKFPEKLGGLCR